jgi:hypothetical protein
MTLTAGLIIGAVVGALIGYLVWRSGGTTLARNPHSTVIVFKRTASGDCKADVDQYRIGNKKNNKVYWSVDLNESTCAPGNDWYLELRFEDAADGTTWNNGTIRVNANGVTPWRIPSDAHEGIFKYHVWMIGARTYEVFDPELQIEP